MILVDYIGHLVSTESEEELHKFALEQLHMKRAWYEEGGYAGFKHPHYDIIGQTMLQKALRLGAVQVPTRELIERAWWRK